MGFNSAFKGLITRWGTVSFCIELVGLLVTRFWKLAVKGTEWEIYAFFRLARVFCLFVISNAGSMFPVTELPCLTSRSAAAAADLAFLCALGHSAISSIHVFCVNQAETNKFCCDPQMLPCTDIAFVDLCWVGAYLAAINSAFCVIVLRLYCQVQRPT